MTGRVSALIASKKPEVTGEEELSAWECSDCGNTSVITAGVKEPFCVHCGSGDLEKLEAAAEGEDKPLWQGAAESLKVADKDSLSGIQCSNCETWIIMGQETAQAHEASYKEIAGDKAEENVGRLQCPVCAEDVGFYTNAAAEEETAGADEGKGDGKGKGGDQNAADASANDAAANTAADQGAEEAATDEEAETTLSEAEAAVAELETVATEAEADNEEVAFDKSKVADLKEPLEAAKAQVEGLRTEFDEYKAADDGDEKVEKGKTPSRKS